jgi:hypothetical protein
VVAAPIKKERVLPAMSKDGKANKRRYQLWKKRGSICQASLLLIADLHLALENPVNRRKRRREKIKQMRE